MDVSTLGGDSPLHLHIIAADTGNCNRLLSRLRQAGEALTATVQTPQAWSGDSDCDVLLLMDAGAATARIRREHAATQPGYPLLVAGGDEELPADLPALVCALKPRLALQREVHRNRRLARQLLGLEQQLARLVAASTTALAFVAGDRHLYYNSAYAVLVAGHDDTSLTGTSLLDRVAAQDRRRLAAALKKGTPDGPLTVAMTGATPAAALQLALSPSLYKGQACVLVEASAAPGTGQERVGQSPDERDLITRLDNLPHFMARLDAAITAAVNHDTASILLVARIDRFRRVQEAIGKVATLHVLADIAGFLQDGISKPYTGTRLSQDEFGILLFGATAQDGARLAAYIAGKVNSSLLPPADRDIALGVSTGLAVINRHCGESGAVIQRARLNTGHSRKHGVDPGAGHAAELPERIQRSLAAGRLSLRFQPVVSLRPGAQPTYETTFVLTQEDGSALAGDDVLACANLYDIGKRIDKLVLERVLALDSEASFQVALSTSTLACPDMPAWLAGRLHRHRCEGVQLQCLVSEIDLHSNRDEVLRFCTAIDALGIGILLSDFGCAPDPLPALTLVRPAGVRLDRSLVRDLPWSRPLRDRLRKLIAAAHHQQTGVAVTALEDCTLLPLLFDLGVDQVQGDCLQESVPAPAYAFPRERVLNLPDGHFRKCS